MAILFYTYQDGYEALDNNFNYLKPSEVKPVTKDGKMFVRFVRKTKLFGFIPFVKNIKEYGFLPTQENQDQTPSFNLLSKKEFKYLKERFRTAERIYDEGVVAALERNGNKPLNISREKLLRGIGVWGGSILVFASLFLGLFLTANKNFTGKTLEISSYQDWKEGSFVATEVYPINAISTYTEIERNGRKTSKSDSEIYYLATIDPESLIDEDTEKIDTAIVIMDNNDRSKQISRYLNAGIDKPEKIEGEIDELNSINDLDDGTDIVTEFTKSIDQYNKEIDKSVEYEYNNPSFVIDTRVTRAELLPSILPSIASVGFGVALLGLAIYSNLQITQKIKKYYK